MDRHVCIDDDAHLQEPAISGLTSAITSLSRSNFTHSPVPRAIRLDFAYYWHIPESVILRLLAYPKNEQENLTSTQLKALKPIIENEFP